MHVWNNAGRYRRVTRYNRVAMLPSSGLRWLQRRCIQARNAHRFSRRILRGWTVWHTAARVAAWAAWRYELLVYDYSRERDYEWCADWTWMWRRSFNNWR